MTTSDNSTPHITIGEDGTPIKDAATFLQLREHDGKLQVFAIRRASTMVFAGGVMAFPGGGVDDVDFVAIPDSGPSVDEWSARLGVSPERAGAIRTAAVRECFEETGVLLAHSPDNGSVAQQLRDLALGPEQIRQWRQRLDTHQESLTAFLSKSGLVADSSRLKELSRWITPPGNPRRYDTFFFAIAIADDEGPDGSSAEFDAAGWFEPQEILDQWKKHEIMLLPPTIVSLQSLVDAGSIDNFMAQPSQMDPIRNDLREQFTP